MGIYAPKPSIRVPHDPRNERYRKKAYVNGVHIEEYVVEHKVEHAAPFESIVLFGINWYTYNSDEDTSEPVEHLSRSLIVKYHRQNMTTPPCALESPQLGYIWMD